MVCRQSVHSVCVCVCLGDTGGERTDWQTDGQTRSASKPLQGPSVKIPSEMNLASENEAATWCVCIWLCWCWHYLFSFFPIEMHQIDFFFFIVCPVALSCTTCRVTCFGEPTSVFATWSDDEAKPLDWSAFELVGFGGCLWTQHRLKTGGRGCHGDAT